MKQKKKQPINPSFQAYEDKCKQNDKMYSNYIFSRTPNNALTTDEELRANLKALWEEQDREHRIRNCKSKKTLITRDEFGNIIFLTE